MTQIESVMEEVKWNSSGLVPCVAQCHQSGRILMLAWMNAAALQATIEKNEMVYWSRSRQSLWHKGETSGHIQKLIELQLDCDGDTLLARVDQIGGIACHTGTHSCFFRTLEGGKWQTTEAPLKPSSEIYRQ